MPILDENGVKLEKVIMENAKKWDKSFYNPILCVDPNLSICEKWGNGMKYKKW